MRWRVALCSAVCLASLGWAGEIIIVDPAREKAQRQQEKQGSRTDELRDRLLEDTRVRSGRPPGQSSSIVIEEAPPSPAVERAREARGYLDESAVPPAPTLIIKSGPPPSEATQAREKARAWVAPSATQNTARCKTENTVGGIEGTTQGHTVIHGNTSGVTICK